MGETLFSMIERILVPIFAAIVPVVMLIYNNVKENKGLDSIKDENRKIICGPWSGFIYQETIYKETYTCSIHLKAKNKSISGEMTYYVVEEGKELTVYHRLKGTFLEECRNVNIWYFDKDSPNRHKGMTFGHLIEKDNAVYILGRFLGIPNKKEGFASGKFIIRKGGVGDEKIIDSILKDPDNKKYI